MEEHTSVNGAGLTGHVAASADAGKRPGSRHPRALSRPKRSLSKSPEGIAEQFTLTMMRALRLHRLGTARARGSLPVPVLHMVRTVRPLSATIFMSCNIAGAGFKSGLPEILPRPGSTKRR